MTSRVHTVDPTILSKNANALLAYSKKQKQDQDLTKKLFQEASKIFLQLNFCATPSLKNKNFFFKLSKSPNFDPEKHEVCLFVKNEPGKDKYEQRDDLKKLYKISCPFVTEVLPLSLVKSDFKSHEQRRVLCNSYDFFVADRDVYDKLPKILGTHFIKSRKMPRKMSSLNEESNTLAERLTEKLSLAQWFVDGRGTCTSIICGNSDFTPEELIQNIDELLTNIAKESPRGWPFIRSVHLKMDQSIALKLYERGENQSIPTELSEMEQHTQNRLKMPSNELVQSYQKIIASKAGRHGFKKRKSIKDKNLLGKIQQPAEKKAKMVEA